MSSFAGILDISSDEKIAGASFLGGSFNDARQDYLISSEDIQDTSSQKEVANQTQQQQGGKEAVLNTPLYRMEGRELKADAPEIERLEVVDGQLQLIINGREMTMNDAIETYGGSFDMTRRIEEALISQEFTPPQPHPQPVMAA